MTSQTQTDIQAARRIVHAPEAFSKQAVRLAVRIIVKSPDATEEDRYWADAASDI